jgi:hypothetical protein
MGLLPSVGAAESPSLTRSSSSLYMIVIRSTPPVPSVDIHELESTNSALLPGQLKEFTLQPWRSNSTCPTRKNVFQECRSCFSAESNSVKGFCGQGTVQVCTYFLAIDGHVVFFSGGSGDPSRGHQPYNIYISRLLVRSKTSPHIEPISSNGKCGNAERRNLGGDCSQE